MHVCIFVVRIWNYDEHTLAESKGVTRNSTQLTPIDLFGEDLQTEQLENFVRRLAVTAW